MSFNNDFKIKDNLNTLGKILSGGVDIAEIFAPSNTSWKISAEEVSFDISGGETITLVGGNGVGVRLDATTEFLTITGVDATATSKGVASFNSDDFTVTNGAVSVKTGGIDNNQLKTASTSNNANNIVIRDGSGGFAAGNLTITGDVSASNTVSANIVDSVQVDAGNVTIANNTISTTNLNGNLILDPNGSGKTDVQGNLDATGIINAFGGNSNRWNEAYSTISTVSAYGVLTETITTDLAVGNVSAAQVLTKGTTLQELTEAIFFKIYNPTFTNPTIGVTSSIGTNVEIGTQGLTVTVTFASGNILGKTVNNIWDESAFQNPRSGILSGGQIFDQQINSRTSINTIASTSAARIILPGSNIFSVRADYGEGPQPLNSKNQSFGSPLPAGNLTSSVTVNGYRRAFWGADTNNTAPTDSTEIRNLPGWPANNTLMSSGGANGSLRPLNGVKFYINVPANSERAVFAYPSNLRNFTSVWDRDNNVPYTASFNSSSPATVSVSGNNSLEPTDYKVYTYVPAIPWSTAIQLEVII